MPDVVDLRSDTVTAPSETMRQAMADAALGRPVSMDGARLFNASVATGIPPAEYARRATAVMACLSKGLGAPIGSVFAASADDVDRARLERKRLGGSMRQVGVLA